MILLGMRLGLVMLLQPTVYGNYPAGNNYDYVGN